MCFELYVSVYKVSEETSLKLRRSGDDGEHTPSIDVRDISDTGSVNMHADLNLASTLSLLTSGGDPHPIHGRSPGCWMK